MLRPTIVLALIFTAVAGTTLAQNRVDTVTPAAPELASYGKYAIGVRTMQVTDRNRPDILNIKEGGPTARYDRTLTLEVWYPALLGPAQKAGGEYRAITRDPAITATLYGQAVRDAAPLKTEGALPLVIVSHGYPGNRFLMSHLGENLASKGFVVASIDHKDSTYDDQKAFGSTLYNRPFDQLFVLNEMERLARPSSASFLSGLMDASRTGLVGYSMGGYGVVNVVGGGYSSASETVAIAPPNRMLAQRGAASPEYRKTIDARIKAAIAIGPWGMQVGFWDSEGLKGIRTPMLFVAGSVDDVSGYEKGTRAIYQGAVNADRYLLTFVNANHNAGAPIPAPAETYAYSEAQRSYPFTHYADAVWDTARMNNILDHFATAFFDLHLKGDQNKKTYLEIVANGKDGVYSLDGEGKPTATHTYWKGFKRGTAVGLMLEHAPPAAAQAQQAGVSCVPVVERAGRELGCFIVASQKLGALGSSPVFWHLDRYPSRPAADAAKGRNGVVVESLGGTWLLTIGDARWRARGGERVSTVGPIPIAANHEYTAQYMEAIFKPGMKSAVHTHSGPEAWYTLTGETCLETPQGAMTGRAGGQNIIVPGGPPMELTATGTGIRRALVLILHDSSQPATSPVSDWVPKGLCK